MSSERPRLLDLFCGAGGATKGYQNAGFHVVGIDYHPMPNYAGDEFIRADALEALRALSLMLVWQADYSAIHASPPCQAYTAYGNNRTHVRDDHPELIAPVRELLEAIRLPWVIENVPGARGELRNPVQLCGSSFGLDVQRHRLFECSFPIMVPPCNHSAQAARFPAATNRAKDSRKTVEVGVWRIPLEVQQRAMGIDWMTLPELSQAIPPAYTEHIGSYLMAEVLRRRRVAA